MQLIVWLPPSRQSQDSRCARVLVADRDRARIRYYLLLIFISVLCLFRSTQIRKQMYLTIVTTKLYYPRFVSSFLLGAASICAEQHWVLRRSWLGEMVARFHLPHDPVHDQGAAPPHPHPASAGHWAPGDILHRLTVFYTVIVIQR